MDEKIYTLTLADGTVIENLKMNGDNFISTQKIDAAIFESNCTPVIISDGVSENVHEYMEYVEVANPTDNGYWFGLRDVSKKEMEDIALRSDLEYIAMMTGIEL